MTGEPAPPAAPTRPGWSVLVVLGALGLVVGALWAFQRSLVYLPDRRPPPPAAAVIPGGRDVTLVTADGLRLGAWYVPAPATTAATVLVTPGNSGNRLHRVDLARSLVAEGNGVLLIDYRGYGGNPGHPSQEGLAKDARAAREFLVERAGVRQDALVYLGESLGAAVSARLAAEHRPAALVLRSPFTSLAAAARTVSGLPVGWLLRDRFDVRDAVGGVAGLPVAVVYGTADATVPAGQSRVVADAARAAGATVVEVPVAGAGHNDAALTHGPELRAAVRAVVLAAGRVVADE